MSKTFFLLLCLISPINKAVAIDFYVSPMGDDQANGLSPESDKQNAPFLTIAKAQQAVRALKTTGQFKQSVTIHIAAGHYTLALPLNFDIRDTGFSGREIHWQGEKDKTFISGGIQLVNCTAEQDKLWSCPLANIQLHNQQADKMTNNKPPVPNFNLFVNQQRMHLARWPDYEWAHIRKAIDEKTTFTSMEAIPNINFQDAQVQLHIYASSDWSDHYHLLADIDTNLKQIHLAEASPDTLSSGHRYYLENIANELNAPGEWFYQQKQSKILFIPVEQIHQDTPIVISNLNSLVNIANANYLYFTNLGFANTIGTTINIKNAQHIVMDHIEISHADSNALEAQNSTDFTLANSLVYDMGGAGVAIDGGDRNTLAASNNLIYNNHFHHLGKHFFSWSPAITIQGVGAKVLHNLVEYLPGVGTAMTGNNHLFENNEINHICEQSSDCGAFYSGRNWTYRGNIIRSNYFHDFTGYGLKSVDLDSNTVSYQANGAVGVYLDDGMSGFTVTGNIFNHAGFKAIQIGGGRDNIIENNLFFTDLCAICLDSRWPSYDWSVNKKTLAEVAYQNPVWQKQYPALSQPFKHENWPENNIISRNIIVSNSSEQMTVEYRLPSLSNVISQNLLWSTTDNAKAAYTILDKPEQTGFSKWQDWLNMGIEKNSIYADPCASITGNKVKFCKNSPINKIKFAPLSNNIGLVK